MTERPEHEDQAERIRRLQERRASSGRSQAAGSVTTVTRPATATGRKRRRHPAAASRILLAGLSVASFFTIGGSLMLAQSNATTQTTPAVVGQVSTSGTTTSPVTSATPATATAKASTQNAPTVHTTTRGS